MQIRANGYFQGSVDFDPGVTINNLTSLTGSYDIYVSKLDLTGNYLWSLGFGGTLSDYGNAIDLDNNGNIFITGSTSGIVDYNPGPGTYTLTNSGSNIFISKFDSNGNFTWAKPLTGLGGGIGYSISVYLNSLFISGRFIGPVDFNPPSANNLYSSGGTDVFIAKYNTAVGIQEGELINYFKTYPNPNEGQFTVELNKKYELVNIKIYDALGRVLLNEYHYNTNEIKLDLKCESGLYLINLLIEEKNYKTKIVKHL